MFAITEPSDPDGSLSSQTHSETLRILMFSALASHLVSVTSTILVTLLAYRSATQWLRASENPDNVNLSPIQYGLLVRTLGSGSLMAIINTLRYTSRSKRARAPRVFKEAFIGVTGIYILSHTVGVIDLWLHSSARSISVFRAVPTQSDAQFGITYNDTICGPFNKTELPCQNLISTQLDGTYWAYDEQWMYLEGYDTIANSNPEISLESVNDVVILVPGPDRNFKSTGFIINTHGLQVECTNLRDQCNRMMAPIIEAFVHGSGPVTNCSKAGYPRIPYYTSGDLKISGRDTRNIQSLVIGIIGDEMGGMHNGTTDFSSGWTSNPASTVVQLRWGNATAQWNSGTPGVSYLNALDLYVTCELSYLDVTAQYDPIEAKWSILEKSLSSPELASVFWTPMIFQLGTDDLKHTLQPYIMNKGVQTVDMLNSLMAKYGIAYAAPLMQFTAASNVTTPQLVAVGLYPAAPTLLLVGCLYLYSLIALVIFFLACTANNRTIFVPRQITRKKERDEERSALDVAQTWLTDPLPFVGSIFPGGDGQHVARSVESDPLLQVYDSDWELGKVGIGLYKGSKGEMIFGLMRQSHSRSKRYGRVFSTVDEDGALQEKVPVHGSTVIGPSLAVIGKMEC
ncbi:hypothetical protein FRC04_001549 [Tulasnella sp. 424]|nr:hypothetical protein FRC04_001549 [Tulasnella sp. 424]